MTTNPILQFCLAEGLPLPLPEFRFAPPRRWRFDMAWPDQKVAVEIEGGVWKQGRHTRGKGYTNDLEKYNQAALLGWLVLRFTVEQVERGEFMRPLERALRQEVTHGS